MSGCLEALDKPVPEHPENIDILTVVAAALIDGEGKILVAKRPDDKDMADLWEFPGGKVEKGELPEFALMRELQEELGIETRPTCFAPITFASHTYNHFHLFMPLYACRVWRGFPRPNEHKELKWVRPNDLYELSMPKADLPLIDPLVQYVGK